MPEKDALRAARGMIASGYQHHSQAALQQMMELMIKGSRSPSNLGLDLSTYADVLAPTRLRGMRNGLICFIAVVSRAAIANGADNELAFALSDYYVNAVELQAGEAELNALMQEVAHLYIGLVRDAKAKAYSLPVTRAIRYIQLHLYDRCRVAEVAAHVERNAQYFSVLFKKETGLAPSDYIAQKKLEEAQSLLQLMNMSVAEVAEALGYCSSSHFIRAYRRTFGRTPKQTSQEG